MITMFKLIRKTMFMSMFIFALATFTGWTFRDCKNILDTAVMCALGNFTRMAVQDLVDLTVKFNSLVDESRKVIDQITEVLDAHQKHIYKVDASITDLIKVDMLADKKLSDLERDQDDMKDDIEADRLKITDISMDLERLAASPYISGRFEELQHE